MRYIGELIQNQRLGTEVEYEKDVDVAVLKKFCPEGTDPNEWIKPFDYNELFKPKSAAEIRRLIGISDPVGSSEMETELPKKESLADMI